ncbi:DUF1990 family protein [Nocardia higoensis]|uniref:DUF1990 family protein n=1 Tax=Nocardia higoensis TaxID=228599 RepID=UPI00030929DC|nr:DUF1990 domain-containing protein [Nocardia higoensis]
MSDDGAGDFTYSAVGATASEPPPGYRRFTRRRRIGRGRPLFERVSTEVMAYRMLEGAGVFGSASSPVAAPGTLVAVRLGVGPAAIRAACRVVYVLDEPDRRGFAYGTLPGHPVSGEELFAVEYDPADESVYAVVTAFSRPAAWYVRLAGPLGRLMQRRMADRYTAALSTE